MLLKEQRVASGNGWNRYLPFILTLQWCNGDQLFMPTKVEFWIFNGSIRLREIICMSLFYYKTPCIFNFAKNGCLRMLEISVLTPCVLHRLFLSISVVLIFKFIIHRLFHYQKSLKLLNISWTVVSWLPTTFVSKSTAPYVCSWVWEKNEKN